MPAVQGVLNCLADKVLRISNKSVNFNIFSRINLAAGKVLQKLKRTSRLPVFEDGWDYALPTPSTRNA